MRSSRGPVCTVGELVGIRWRWAESRVKVPEAVLATAMAHLFSSQE